MKRIEVPASKYYEVIVGAGLLPEAGQRIRAVLPAAERAAVITDDNVGPRYLPELEKSLQEAGFCVSCFVLPHGESSKNADNYVKILNFLAENGITRADLVAALGGGVVGDISGFAAATYLRGISYVQLPTSLLAMVDSSVGGKTAIDLESGKNLAGAFCQPALVLCDLDALDSLSEANFTDGCAEVLKYGVLGDRGLFDHLVACGRDFDREYVVAACVGMKRDYVCEDEFDTGVRRKLNLGHTVGHAIEKCSAYGISHGRAVAVGMAVIARAAARRGICAESCAAEIVSALERLGLDTQSPYTAQELLIPMLSDKKRTGATLSLIVPYETGRCGILPVAVEELENFVKMGL